MWYINATLLRYFFFDRLGNNILNLINYKFTIKSQHIISIIEKEIVEINENVFFFKFKFFIFFSLPACIASLFVIFIWTIPWDSPQPCCGSNSNTPLIQSPKDILGRIN